MKLNINQFVNHKYLSNEEKKGNAGKANWGTAKDEITGVEEGAAEKSIEKIEGETPVEGAEATVEVQAEPEPEEPKKLSLKEFEEQQAAAAYKADLPPKRVVVEDETLKKAVKLEKKGTQQQAKAGEQASKKKKNQNKKQVLALTDVFSDKAFVPQDTRYEKRGPKPQGQQQGGRRGQKFNLQEDSFPALNA